MHPQVSPYGEALRKQLPFELYRTNLFGAFSTPPPPDDFNPAVASPATLVKHGLMWKRPRKVDSPSLLRAWDRVFNRKWVASDRVVPILKPQTGKTHVLRRLAKPVDHGYTSANWSGGVIQGQWATALGFWEVPAGGPNSSSWIGLDGFSSDDVLQAGIEQRAAADGEAHYVAWFEWFAPPETNSPLYICQTDVTNFPLGTGHQVFCSIQYILNKTAGQIYFANDTTGQHFCITLAPPPGAKLAGDSMEWIVEAPLGGGEFAPVQFTTALGCSADSQTVGNPQNGDHIEIVDNHQRLTSVELGDDSVTIRFAG